MKITPYNSKKITALNFVLILLVLYIHNSFVEAEGYPLVMALQHFMGGNGLASAAVPLFFVISGMLFFNKVDNISQCLAKQKKRVKTLLIPYILWNLIFVLCFAVMSIIPGINGLISADYIGTFFGNGMVNAVKQIFYVPAAFHLWFLRDLLLFVVFTPILLYLLRFTKWLAPVILIFMSVHLLQSGFYDTIEYGVFRFDGIVLFSIGGCIAKNGSLEQLDRLITKPIIVIATIVYFGNAVWHISNNSYNCWYNFATALCGCIVVWKGYDYIFNLSSINNKTSILTPYLGYSFFIYLFHEPTLNIIKKLCLKIVGVHEWSLVLLYIVIPIIMAFIAIAVAKALQRLTPRAYKILTGNR